jgi:hypothetical protein
LEQVFSLNEYVYDLQETGAQPIWCQDAVVW